MKVSKEVAAANRQALLSAAAVLYRQKGFDAVTIADVGAAAGLTHGALYGHFRSKDPPLSATVGGLFEWTAEQVRRAGNIDAFLDLYLSRRHVDNPGAGCPLAALGGDTARARPRVKADFARGFEHLVEAFSDLVGKSGGDASRRAAISAIASLVGAVVLARATDNKKLSNEVLATVRANVEAN